MFENSIEFAEEHFGDRKRLVGNLVVEHNLAIGSILAENKLFPEVVVAGILYGVETEILPSKIQEKFGREIADLVFGQLQLKEIKSKNESAESEVLRRILLATLNDLRIIFVKLADKLDNLNSIEIFSPVERKEIAEEVLEIYAPLANRLGIDRIKKQLEDLAFKVLNPKKYGEIEEFLKESREEREKYVKDFVQEIFELLKNDVKILKIKGREKHIYSIYRKIVERGVPLDKQRDHFAVRILVKNESDCYNALGILNQNFVPMENTLKDYILNPKPNGYKSLHTSLRVGNKIVEVQIRTNEMDELAEEGAAAHWSYKKMKSDSNFEKKVAWLRSVLDLQTEDKDLLRTVKTSLFADRFYCYTPKGKVIDLPTGASVLDFAYHIHQEIGNKAVGGRVNGVFAPLKKELKADDVVEIITNKCQQPRRDWMKFVVSARAKSIIKREIKNRENIPVSASCGLKKGDKDIFDSLVYSEEFPNHVYEFARCCSPVPDKEILGVMKSHRRILVHNKNCEKLRGVKDKFAPLFWRETFNRPVKIFVGAKERAGILADLLNTISRGGFVVKEASAKMIGNDAVECFFVIVPQKLENIVKLIKRIEKVPGFRKARFE